jgi:SAM-dependent methyltransferase
MNSQTELQPGTLCFQCNICSANSSVDMEELGREKASCRTCGSTARLRAIIRALSVELLGRNTPLANFPTRKDIVGFGMTDWEGYSKQLAEKFSYRNTYLHQEPYFDTSAASLAPDKIGLNDFILSSEVFEHVVPPVSKAFKNVYDLLKPGGVLVMTVPYGLSSEITEHFPDLSDYTVIEEDGTYRLRNVTAGGVVQEFGDLVFHGGPGSTLEMRVFCETGLLEHLKRAGFDTIAVYRQPDFSHGIWWPEPWAFPVSARKPRL